MASSEGMTVFLTTQYLEEADRLADRVGIIDRGTIVAEGTPTQLKSEVGEPAVEATPLDPADRDRLVEVMCRFGSRGEHLEEGNPAVSVRLSPGHNGLQGVVRELDSAGIELADLQLHAPTLDDVFLEKTGRKLEGAGGEEGEVTTGEHEAVPA